MKIKERADSKFYVGTKNLIKKSIQITNSKKVKLTVIILLIIISAIIGILIGLLISGFFGTLQNPSERGIQILHFLGIQDLRDIQERLKSISKENIKIPYNYIKGQFSNPEKIYIDINYDNYKKLEYKRAEAIDLGLLISSEQEYVPATITYKNKIYNSKLRLKGKWIDHIEGDKWSLRIKIKDGETLMGMKTFSLQDPKTRDYLNEFLYHQVLKKEGILSLRYNFVEVIINGDNKGIYALEEYFGKELIEYNKRREGVILRFNDDHLWNEIKEEGFIFEDFSDKDNEWFYSSTIGAFDEDEILPDKVKSAQFEEARMLLESFRQGNLKTSEVFDIDKLAKYFAISTLLEAHHTTAWANIRLYYNPVTSLLEPIGFDAEIGRAAYQGFEPYSQKCLRIDKETCPAINNYYGLFFSDPIFFEKYIKELERMSQESYLDSIFFELDKELKKNKDIIHKDTPTYHFFKEDFYNYQEIIRAKLSPTKAINAYFQETSRSQSIILSLGNIEILPIEIIGAVFNETIPLELEEPVLLQRKTLLSKVEYKEAKFKLPDNLPWKEEYASLLKVNYKIFGTNYINSKRVLPWSFQSEDILERSFIRQEPNPEEFEFLTIYPGNKEILIQEGSWTVNKSLIIPPGFTVKAKSPLSLNLISGSTILSYSALEFLGNPEDLIKIFSTDNTGQGIAVLSAEESTLKNVKFDGLSVAKQNNWELTGAVTFYESPVIIDGSFFSNLKAEDSLNIINSKFLIKNSTFEKGQFDCLDIDFGEGTVESSLFLECGNDGLDISGAVVNLNNLRIIGSMDKGFSGGEKSTAIGSNIEINGGYICIAGKDQSYITLINSSLSNCEYGFAVYEKKTEFGPAFIDSIGTIEKNNTNKEIVEKGSTLTIENKIKLGSEESVFNRLYPNG